MIAASDAGKEALYPPQFYLYVPDVDAWYDRAVRAGAKPTFPPADQDYGDRGAGVTDEWGNFWFIARRTTVMPTVPRRSLEVSAASAAEDRSHGRRPWLY